MRTHNDFLENWPSLQEAILAKQGGLGSPPTEQEIERAQSDLNIYFPAAYYRFILDIGAALWPQEILGLGAGVPPGYNVLLVNLWERSEATPRLPAHFLAFSPDGWGNHYCIDLQKGSEREGCIVIWNHNLDEHQTPIVTHISFMEWLISKIRNAPEED